MNINEIIALLKEGKMTRNAIGRKFNTSGARIKYIAKLYNIPYTYPIHEKVVQGQISREKILKLYRENKTPVEIAKELNFTVKHIKNTLRKWSGEEVRSYTYKNPTKPGLTVTQTYIRGKNNANI